MDEVIRIDELLWEDGHLSGLDLPGSDPVADTPGLVDALRTEILAALAGHPAVAARLGGAPGGAGAASAQGPSGAS
ncbi:hypothetical protein ACH4SP_00130 [Streptomyces sp. NPDC021093]|uniref:hypothetical protein n=1 Tax=Streptomyces sp. NPDC021093 TaxID=3365112 RepID=UPI0037A3E82F